MSLSKKIQEHRAEGELNLRKIVDLLFEHHVFVLIITGLCILGSTLYVLARAPVFESQAMVAINQITGTDVITSALIDKSFGSTPLLTEITIMQSRSVLGQAVEKEHLDITVTPRVFPWIGQYFVNRYNTTHPANEPAPALFGLTQYVWGGTQVNVPQFDVPSTFVGHTFTLEYQGDQRFNLLYQGQLLGSGQVGSALTFHLPTGAEGHIMIDQFFAQTGSHFFLVKQPLVSAVGQLKGALTIQETIRGTDLIFLSLTDHHPERALKKLNAVVEAAVDSSVRRKANEAILALNFLHRQLPLVKSALERAEKMLNDYRSKTGNVVVNSEAEKLMSQIAQIESDLSRHTIVKAQLQQRYTEESFQIEQTNTTIEQLKTQKNKLDQKLRKVPNTDQAAISLMREVQTQNSVYTTLLGQLQQFELLKAGTQGRLSVIDTADYPAGPINKPASFVISCAALLGFFLSFVLIYIKSILYQGIQDPDQIESDFNLPVLSTLLYSKIHHEQLQKFKKNKIKFLKLLADIDPHDQTVEGFRSLRTNLLFKTMDTGAQVIAISGPTPGVGKSFSSVNLAHIFSELGKRVLLIDADTRQGDLHTFFNQKRFPGLCDLLAGHAQLKDVVQNASSSPYLDFIATGTMPEKHAELLMGPQLKALIEYFKQQYDFIVIDTPPVLAVTDASILMKQADIRLIVLAHGKHDQHEITMTIQKFERSGVTLDGIIFNMASGSHSYYGYRYAYRYSYRNSDQSSTPVQEPKKEANPYRESVRS